MHPQFPSHEVDITVSSSDFGMLRISQSVFEDFIVANAVVIRCVVADAID